MHSRWGDPCNRAHRATGRPGRRRPGSTTADAGSDPRARKASRPDRPPQPCRSGTDRRSTVRRTTPLRPSPCANHNQAHPRPPHRSPMPANLHRRPPRRCHCHRTALRIDPWGPGRAKTAGTSGTGTATCAPPASSAARSRTDEPTPSRAHRVHAPQSHTRTKVARRL